MDQESTQPVEPTLAYPDAEIVDYGSAAEIVQNTGSGGIDDGSGAAIYSS